MSETIGAWTSRAPCSPGLTPTRRVRSRPTCDGERAAARQGLHGDDADRARRRHGRHLQPRRDRSSRPRPRRRSPARPRASSPAVRREAHQPHAAASVKHRGCAPRPRPTRSKPATPSRRSPGATGSSTASVLALNGLGWKSLIFPGQVLKLTAGAAPTAPRRPRPPPAVATRSRRATRSADRRALRRLHPGGARPRTASAGRASSTRVRPSRSPAAALAVDNVSNVDAGRPRPPPEAPAAPPPAPPAPVSLSYVIKSGDTVSSIAARFGVSIQCDPDRERAHHVEHHLQPAGR